MKKPVIVFFIAIIIAFFAAARKTNLITRLDIISSNPNPLIRHFAPTWRSLKKIIDLPYLIASLFMAADPLPVYEINLSKNDRFNLLNNLPDYPKENRLNEEFKNTIKAGFNYGSYAISDAKIRYRGTSPNHWNAIQKSIQVNLPNDMPLGDRTVLRFFIGQDRGWTKELFWNHLAKKLAILAPTIEMAELIVDKKSKGVYVLVEGWEESFFERNGRQLGRFMTNKSLTGISKSDFLLAESASLWQDRNEQDRSTAAIPEFNYFLWLISAAPKNVFEKEIENILDMDYFLRWTLATVFSGNFHQGNGANINFYINPATGKFEPIFFDASFEKLGGVIDVSKHRVVNRVLQNDHYRAQFEKIARAYVEDSSNIADDFSFYDAQTTAILPAIYRDTQKIQTSFEVKQTIRANRETYWHNIITLQRMLKENGVLAFRYADETYPLSQSPDQFDSFHAISASRGEFLAAYPQFVAGVHPQTVILLPGTHTFFRDIIVPRDLHMVIRENATLLFAPNISLISYSPITARGYAEAPIAIRPLVANQPWGVFALINTSEKNVFTHTRIQGGKDATINGVYFSGMLSTHNADLEFRYGTVENAHADDGIHILSGEAIITDTLFRNNSSDGIDVDFAKGESLFERNLFTATGGDAMDLSFSNITVRENTVQKCGDKGISIGEASTPRIGKNTIEKCVYGIAVKDRSKAIISNNILKNNETAIGLYRKKPHFISGGAALLIENTFIGNKQDTFVDEYSKIIK